MTLNEKRKEQVQSRWPSRFAKERLDLSVSVGETLGGTVEEEQDELTEQDNSVRPERSTTVVPPRLSLQSRVLPVVQSASSDETIAGVNFEVVSVEAEQRVNEEEEEKTENAGQNANIFTRFAQRLTVSLAAFGGSMHSEAIPALPPPASDELQRLSMQHEISLLPPTIEVEVLPEPARQKQVPDLTEQIGIEGPLVRVLKAQEPHPTAPKKAEDTARSLQGRQRLAGRTSRIHLETAPVPTAFRPTKTTERSTSAHVYDEQTSSYPPIAAVSEEMGTTVLRLPVADAIPKDDHAENIVDTTAAHLPAKAVIEMTGDQLPAVDPDHWQYAANSELTYLPAILSLEEERGRTSTHLPTVEKVHSGSHGTLSGSGTFESGQGEVTVMNPCVTSSSVILVTLTTNPGPVVAQYISLQPRVGFTVHLTAPTVMKTSFNYIILLGELF